MIDNWKNLKEFKGYLNSITQDEQTEMLQAAGIICIISAYDDEEFFQDDT